MDVMDESKKMVDQAKKKMLIRAGIFIVLIMVTVIYINTHWHNALYYLNPSTPEFTGDVREIKGKGIQELPIDSWSYVRLENLLITHTAVSETKKYNIFFCPIFNILVRTQKELPEGDMRVNQAEIPEHLVYLVEQRKVSIDDFNRRFDAQGLIVKFQDMSTPKSNLKDYIQKEVGIPEGNIDNVLVLLDGENPESHLVDFLLMLGIGIFVLVAFVSVIFAIRDYLRLSSILK